MIGGGLLTEERQLRNDEPLTPARETSKLC